MRLKSWYILLLGAWTLLGLPGLIMAFLWSGGDLQSALPSADAYAIDIAVWLVAVAWMISPLWLAPFGVVLKRR